ncbi:hypothetical protein [Nocardia rhizosphaerae]|uniref:PknH-like protein n=1 Tax=Nocardia rhizosphaerae TaxID=1691571 RepID=A0ABV8LCP2_9NOCA
MAMSYRGRIVLHPAARVLILAIAIGVVAGCTSQQQPPNNTIAGSTSAVSGRSQIRHLTEDLLLPESDFPAGGEFHRSAIEVVRNLDAPTDSCDPRGWVRDGDQETAANVMVGADERLRYSIQLFAVGEDLDVVAWKMRCLPRTDSKEESRAATSTVLPDWAVVVETARVASDKLTHWAAGSHRGILVMASVSGPRNAVTADSRTLIERMFNAQIERFDARIPE